MVCAVAFLGEFVIPEYPDDFDYSTDPETMAFVNTYKYSDSTKKYIHSGRLHTYSGNQEDYSQTMAFDKFTPSRHFTIVFNVFVMLQFFNFLNARKIYDEINIFQHILSNTLFFIILFIILGLQFVFVTFGYRALYVYKHGLTWQHWLICIVLGSLGLVWSAFIKFIPDRLFPQLGSKQTEINLTKKTSLLNLKRGLSFDLKATNFGGDHMQ